MSDANANANDIDDIAVLRIPGIGLASLPLIHAGECYQEIRSRRGQLFYAPASLYSVPYPSFVYFRPRVARPLILQVVHAPTDAPYLPADPPNVIRTVLKVRKLANTRESAKRFFRFKASTPAGSESRSTAACSTTVSSQRSAAAAGEMILGERGNNGNGGPNAAIGGPISGMLHRPTLADNIRTASTESGHSASSKAAPAIGDEKPIASGNGVSISIALAEPVLFLQGYDQHDTTNRTTAMLRGNLHLKVVKSAKIKAVTLKFRGKAETEWPEGIPPKKTEFKDIESIMNHTWPFFNAQFESANQESGHGADHVEPLKGVTATTKEIVPSLGVSSSSFDHFQRSSRIGSDGLTSRDAKRLSLQLKHTRSFGKGDSSSGPSIAQKGYRLFTPGDYIYSFELPIDSRMPETINVELGRVKYELEAIVERAGAFRANLVGSKEVILIRTPAENSLETVEPIAISRDWEDQLHYDIVISGKSFPLGAQVPIAFKLTPLAKVQCHRIKVFVTENVQYYTSNRRVHRLEPTRKIHLFEKRADAPSTSAYSGSTVRITAGGGVAYDGREAAARGDESVQRDTTNLLGDLAGEHNVGPTEMEFNVQLPSCHAMKEKERSARIHFDTTYHNIQVHHWIKIVMRLSRPDAVDPTKRRHFEISIDSPFNILSCRATQANTSLPAYTSPESASLLTEHFECGCPGAPRRKNSPSSLLPTLSSLRNGTDASSSSLDPSTESLTRPPPAHLHDPNSSVSRPMHLLRAPSFNPPAFEDEEPPPPMITPPPKYETLMHGDQNAVLADYFARLADELGDDEHGVISPSRVDLPLTPGGRVNRSMDELRTWVQG